MNGFFTVTFRLGILRTAFHKKSCRTSGPAALFRKEKNALLGFLLAVAAALAFFLASLGILALLAVAAALGFLAALGRIRLLAASLLLVALGCIFALLACGSTFGSLLVLIAAATYHGDSRQNDNERENLFHGVKRLNYEI